MRSLSSDFRPYEWSESTDEIGRRFGLDPIDVVRFDANVPPQPLASSRPAAIARTLATINEYPHGGYPELVEAIARYAGVEPANVVLGAGADDLILLCARAFAGPGDVAAIAQEPTYPLYRIAIWLAGAEVGEAEPVVTFCCRPNNPTGTLDALPPARPLVVDEAYFEYAGDGAVDRLAEGVVVLRTFSKAFGLAGARVGYALADADTASELQRRQAPAPVSTASAALAIAALSEPLEIEPVLEERERLRAEIRALGLDPLPSAANFVFVPVGDPASLRHSLMQRGLVVRASPTGIRITVRDRDDDDLLLDALSDLLGRDRVPRAAEAPRVRHLRATAETRVRVRLGLRGRSRVHVATGAGLYDHLFEQLGFHAGFDLILETVGDLETGPHHTVEDSALALGEALDRALGTRTGITRYGNAVIPMDDALGRAAVDLGTRPWHELRLEHDPGLAAHALASLARAGRFGLHVEASGRDDHHVAEAAFKAVGRALRAAAAEDIDGARSTKGVM